jgi:hypothetical protein
MAHDFTELMTRGGFSAKGLFLSPFRPDLLPLINEWSRAAEMPGLNEAVIPPLGVVVSDGIGPASAMWCFECYGVGIAYLEYAVTRPGLEWTHAANVLGVAACFLMSSAGRSVEPPGEYHTFRGCGRLANFRVLKRLGFERAGTFHHFVCHN